MIKVLLVITMLTIGSTYADNIWIQALEGVKKEISSLDLNMKKLSEKEHFLKGMVQAQGKKMGEQVVHSGIANEHKLSELSTQIEEGKLKMDELFEKYGLMLAQAHSKNSVRAQEHVKVIQQEQKEQKQLTKLESRSIQIQKMLQRARIQSQQIINRARNQAQLQRNNMIKRQQNQIKNLRESLQRVQLRRQKILENARRRSDNIIKNAQRRRNNLINGGQQQRKSIIQRAKQIQQQIIKNQQSQSRQKMAQVDMMLKRKKKLFFMRMNKLQHSNALQRNTHQTDITNNQASRSNTQSQRNFEICTSKMKLFYKEAKLLVYSNLSINLKYESSPECEHLPAQTTMRKDGCYSLLLNIYSVVIQKMKSYMGLQSTQYDKVVDSIDIYTELMNDIALKCQQSSNWAHQMGESTPEKCESSLQKAFSKFKKLSESSMPFKKYQQVTNGLEQALGRESLNSIQVNCH